MATISRIEAETIRYEYFVRNNLENSITAAQHRRLSAELGPQVAMSAAHKLNRWLRNSFDPDVHPLDFDSTLSYERVCELLNHLGEMQRTRGIANRGEVILPIWRGRPNTSWQRDDIDPEWKQIMKTVTSIRTHSIQGSGFRESSAYRLRRLESDTGLLDGETAFDSFLRSLREQWGIRDINADLIRATYALDIRILCGDNVDTTVMPTFDQLITAYQNYREEEPVHIVTSFVNRQGNQQCAIMIEVASDPQKMRLVEQLWLNCQSIYRVSRTALSVAFHQHDTRCYIENCPCHQDSIILPSPVHYDWDHATILAELRKTQLRFRSGRVIQPCMYNQSQMDDQRAAGDMIPACRYGHRVSAHIRNHLSMEPDEMVQRIGEEPLPFHEYQRGWRTWQQCQLDHVWKLTESCLATDRQIDETNFPAFERHHTSGRRPIRFGRYLIESGKMIDPSQLPHLHFDSVPDFQSAFFAERVITIPLEARIHKFWDFIRTNMPALRDLGVVTLPYDFSEEDGEIVFTGELDDLEGIDEDMLERNADQNGHISLPRTANALEVLRRAAGEEVVEEEREVSHLEDEDSTAYVESASASASLAEVAAPAEQEDGANYSEVASCDDVKDETPATPEFESPDNSGIVCPPTPTKDNDRSKLFGCMDLHTEFEQIGRTNTASGDYTIIDDTEMAPQVPGFGEYYEDEEPSSGFGIPFPLEPGSGGKDNGDWFEADEMIIERDRHFLEEIEELRVSNNLLNEDVNHLTSVIGREIALAKASEKSLENSLRKKNKVIAMAKASVLGAVDKIDELETDKEKLVSFGNELIDEMDQLEDKLENEKRNRECREAFFKKTIASRDMKIAELKAMVEQLSIENSRLKGGDEGTRKRPRQRV